MKGLITEDELNEFCEKEKSEPVESLKLFDQRFDRVFKRAANQLNVYEMLMINNRLLAFARAMNVKLYSATDFTHFTEFSA